MAATDRSGNRDGQSASSSGQSYPGDANLRRIVDTIPDIVWTAGSDGRVDFLNDRWRQVTGLTQDKGLGQGWLQVVHPDDRAAAGDAWRRAVATAQPYEFELRLRQAGGTWCWYVSRGFPEQDDLHDSPTWFGTMTDIEAQKQAEAARRESERFTRRVLDNLFTFAGLLALDGALLLSNEAPLRSAGITFQDVQGKKFWNCYWWNYDRSVQKALRAACARAATGEIVRYDVEVRMAGGRLVPIDFQIAPLHDDQGRITHLIPSAVDIAERHAVEEALRERERRFREMADDLPLMIWLHDAEGQQEFVNQTFCDYFGVSLEQMRGERWQMLTHPDDGSVYIEAFAAAVAQRKPFHAEVRVRRGDGRWRWLESWGRPRFDDGGTYLGHIGTSADVTGRKEAVEALRVSEERLRLAAEATGFGWYDYDVVSGKVTWSDRLKAIVGVDHDRAVTPDELLNRIHPADEARYIQETLEAVDPGGSGTHELEFRLVRDDGRTRWLRDNGRTYFAGEGDHRRPVRVVGMVSDITLRKQAEEALRESQERLAFILENSEDNIFLQDLDLRYVWLARPAQPFSREDYLGQTDMEMAGPLQQRRLLTRLKRQVIETGEPLSTDLTLTPFGQRRHFHAAYKPWLDVAGNIIGLAGYVRDITERKETEIALRESEAKLAAIFKGLPVGVAVVDTAGMILTMNPAGLRLHGFSSLVEMPERLDAYENSFELRYPDGRLMPVPEWPLSRTARGEYVHDYEVLLRRPDGEVRSVAYSVVPIGGPDEHSRHVIFVMHDISVRKRAEAALRRGAERDAFRVALADALRPLTEPAEVQAAATRLLGEYLGASRVIYGDIAASENRAVVLADYDREALPRLAGTYNLADFGLFAGDAFGSGRAVTVDDLSHLPDLAPAEALSYERLGIRAHASVPLIKGGHLAAFLSVQQSSPRRWTPAEVALIEEVAERTWSAVERARAAEALRRLNETLEARVEERTRQVSDLARQLTMSEQEERRRISQILHDDLQQLLYGIEMKLSMIYGDLQNSDYPALAQDVAEGQAWISQAIDQTRELTVDLSPPILQNEGLADALLWLQRQMRELHRLEVTVEAEQRFRLRDDLRVLLFQIVRELLFNVKKHADVDHATVRLVEEDHHLVIHVIDEGRGFDLEALALAATPDAEGGAGQRGYGLYNMRERLNLLGGRLELHSAPGVGTHVVVHAPADGRGG